MDFDFSDEQIQLRDAVRKWVERAYSFEARRAAVRAGGLDRAVYEELARQGLTALTVPEAHDGMGLGAVDAMVVMEELGRGLVLEPLGQAYVASGILSHQGEAAAQARWLPKIASGQALVVLAHQERRARWRLDDCQASARETAGGWAVSGTKGVVPGGDRADAYLVPAMADGRLALFIVERTAPGVTATGYLTQDGSRAGELHLADAQATLVSRDGLAALELGVDIGIAAACAEGVGAMEATLALTADYLNTRKQFGVAIASFQALRHRMADMKMQLELARSMSYYASLKLNAPAEERRQAMARAKYQLGQSLRFVGQQSVQLHGGIGVTDEYIGSHFFKKLTQLELTYGDSLHHLGEVSKRMQETAGVFG